MENAGYKSYEDAMRAETQKIVEEIEQSAGLLRRAL